MTRLHKNPSLRFSVCYSDRALSKKGGVGFGDLKHPYDESRRTPAVSAAFLSASLFYGGSMGGRKACRFPHGLSG